MCKPTRSNTRALSGMARGSGCAASSCDLIAAASRNIMRSRKPGGATRSARLGRVRFQVANQAGRPFFGGLCLRHCNVSGELGSSHNLSSEHDSRNFFGQDKITPARGEATFAVWLFCHPGVGLVLVAGHATGPKTRWQCALCLRIVQVNVFDASNGWQRWSILTG